MTKKKIFIIIFTCILFVLFYSATKKEDYVEQYSNADNLEESSKKHNYDFSKLRTVKHTKFYNDENVGEALVGIDVSYYQRKIDWKKLAKRIDYAMIRLGYRGAVDGKISLDSMYTYNISQANKYKVNTGIYFFSQAISEEEAIEEANFVLKNIKKYKVNFPVVFDMEQIENSRILNLSVEERTNISIAFLEKIEKAGYTPMMYGNPNYLKNYVDMSRLEKYDLWLAEYNDVPTYPYDFKMWQYSENGEISGCIDGKVDFNLCFKDYSK